MKTDQLEFITPAEHINPYLTHWTGNNKAKEAAFEILKQIITTKKLKFSQSPTSFPEPNLISKQQMICFTDTPLKLSSEHCKKYGHVGISFNKEALINDGANPVLYLVENRKRNQKILEDVYYTKNEPRHLISWCAAMTQPYNSKPSDLLHYPEFNEREWRIVRILPFSTISKAEESQGPFNEFPFTNKIVSEEKVKGVDPDFYLPFDLGIIENVIVPKEFESETVSFLKSQNITATIYLVNT